MDMAAMPQKCLGGEVVAPLQGGQCLALARSESSEPNHWQMDLEQPHRLSDVSSRMAERKAWKDSE
jgi:hypothetical protein